MNRERRTHIPLADEGDEDGPVDATQKAQNIRVHTVLVRVFVCVWVYVGMRTRQDTHSTKASHHVRSLIHAPPSLGPQLDSA